MESRHLSDEELFQRLQTRPRGLGQGNELELLAKGPGCFTRLMVGLGLMLVAMLGVLDATADVFLAVTGMSGKATIKWVDYTNTTVNDRDLMRIGFAYEVDGQVYENYNYASRHIPSEGVSRTVVYSPQFPFVSRLEKASNGTLGTIGLWVALGILACFLIPAVFGFRKMLRQRYLLRNGLPQWAALMNRTTTGTQINNHHVYKFTYSFETPNGGTHEIVTKAHQPEKVAQLGSQKDLLVLYDPSRPNNAMLWDEMPIQLNLKANGAFEGPTTAAIVWSVILLVLTWGGFFYSLHRVAKLFVSG